eukprot:CAMPEP_0113438878 /NCGR_PEP_ID=MMETSP0013_2-20120614/38178_1 /TAXON_ID=2843 ORGANISM="Skeletonema costatum, Strain 1716" /NCGR_SAMPLE_ID=MMETSP0013_2 /ASSEMBLY_ACC=CAM_ASM_000158 /LENGTH=754 /DNA_ID=CAMNT_0000329617 /DNA_START=107 /DNA_END=2371 /DNA_ORIENTATION=+ /assembly_acc=CAM_ASM_000158
MQQTQIKRQYSEISIGASGNNSCSDDSNTNNDTSSKKSNNPLEGILNMFSFTRRPGRPQRQQQQQQHDRTGSPQEYVPPTNTTAKSSTSSSAAVHADIIKPSSSKQPKPSSMTTKKSSTSPATSPTAWRTALCPKTQKTYYWNMYTRESRWKKPLELASDEERREIETKERVQKEFFEEMEQNILRRMSTKSSTMVMGSGSSGSMFESCGSSSDGMMFGKSTMKDMASISPGTADTAEISESWTQPSCEEGSLISASGGSNDWIQGWISADSQSVLSSSSSLEDSPGGRSDGAMNGMDDTVRMNSFSPTFSIGSSESRGSSLLYEQEERNDKVLPLVKKSKLERIKSNSSKPVIDKPELVRTISKMEYDLARQLNPLMANDDVVFTPAMGGGQKSFHPECSTPTTQAMDILSGLHLSPESEGVNVSLSDSLFEYSPLTPSEESMLSTTSSFGSSPSQSTNPRRELSRPSLVTKRNTCGTIHVNTTLAAPDQDAMIKCVCGVFRAHLLQSSAAANSTTAATAAADMNTSPYLSAPPQDPKYAVFKDCRPHGDYRSLDVQSIPTLEAVTDFYRSIFVRSQMEIECIIISLIYVERLIKKSKGELRPQSDNWRSILFSCMVLASKVWDDLSMWNCDFSKIGPCGMTFSLQRTNELEIALLSALQYRVKVGASEYAKYYFLLRGMLCRSGLANDDLTRLNPLDVKGATNINSTSGSSGRKLIKRRSKSFSEYSSREESERVGTERRGVSISLEELVPM